MILCQRCRERLVNVTGSLHYCFICRQSREIEKKDLFFEVVARSREGWDMTQVFLSEEEANNLVLTLKPNAFGQVAIRAIG